MQDDVSADAISRQFSLFVASRLHGITLFYQCFGIIAEIGPDVQGYEEERSTGLPSMKKILLTSASIVALNCGAYAADLPSRVQAPVFAAVPPEFTWSGFYIGGIAGANFSDQKASTGQGSCNGYDICAPGYNSGDGSLVLRSTAGQSISGLLGGTIGYNFEFANRIVLGVEADGAWLSGGGHTHSAFGMASYFDGPTTGSEYGTLSNRSRLDSIGTIRGRLGYDLGRTLLFVTGGLAVGSVKTSTSAAVNYSSSCSQGLYSEQCNGAANWSGSKAETRTGFTVGAGIEHALTEHLTIKADALYYNLGSVKTAAKGSGAQSYTTQCCGGCSCGSGPQSATAQPYTAKQKVDGVMARVGLNYKF